MYLLDTNVISEIRKKRRANIGVQRFFELAQKENRGLYLSVVTIGELRRGVELIRYRGDLWQAETLEEWLQCIVTEYSDHILDFTQEEAQIWGKLRTPHHENALDKQIAATALTYDLTLVTRNSSDFEETGVRLLNPFKTLPSKI